MHARFDSAQEQLRKLIKEAEEHTDPDEFRLGYWREQASDILNTIYESSPKTLNYVISHLSDADRPKLLGILESALNFKPPIRVAPKEPADTAYFATLVDRAITRSWFFRGAAILVVTMIGVTVALLGFEIHGISKLSQDVAREIKESRAELEATKSNMKAQIEEARKIRERMKEETAALENILLGIKNDISDLKEGLESAKKILAHQLQELNEVRSTWRIERAAWDEEILGLKNYFNKQKEQFEKDARTILASLTRLLDQGRTDTDRLQSLRGDAEDVSARLNAQLTQAQESVGTASRAAVSAEASRDQIDNLKGGVAAKVAAATSEAESAIASANGLLRRLDSSRDDVEAGLADSDEKQASLSETIEFWDSSHDEWLRKLEAGEKAVSDASAVAIKRIAAVTDGHRTTLDRRLTRANTVVADIERQEVAAADLLKRMKDRNDALRTREDETRATLDNVNQTLSGLQREFAVVTALTEKIEGRRSEAESELDALLAERPPLTIAKLWQAAISSLAVTTTLICSAVSVLLALVALWVSLRRRTGVGGGTGPTG